jgi:hypothetical protein
VDFADQEGRIGDLKIGDLCLKPGMCSRSEKEMGKEAGDQKSRWGFKLLLMLSSRHRGRATIESVPATLIRKTRNATQP